MIVYRGVRWRMARLFILKNGLLSAFRMDVLCNRLALYSINGPGHLQ